MDLRRRLLIIAYHVPPIQGGSGVHRMLSYSRFLPESGWEVKILTVTPNVYPVTSPANLDEIPEELEVIRVPALDAGKHLSFCGRYLRILALPDRWQSWIAAGIWKGSELIRSWRPAVMMSTFPIASAHAIGLGLSHLFDIPWVADFRDPMAQPDYPEDPLVRRSYWWLEERIFRRAGHITVTTRGTREFYRDRYGEEAAERISIIQNGFDESLFPTQAEIAEISKLKNGPLCVLHSGLVYSFERDPTQFFHAIAELKEEGRLDEGRVCFVFRASGYSNEYRKRFSHLRLNGLVRFEDKLLPYRDAIGEMLGADALLVLQGSVCNMQIPAKLYEYLAAGRPVLGLTDPLGDTAGLLQSVGSSDFIRLDSKDEIKRKLPVFIDRLRADRIDLPNRESVLKLSRRSRTKELAHLLESLCSG